MPPPNARWRLCARATSSGFGSRMIARSRGVSLRARTADRRLLPPIVIAPIVILMTVVAVPTAIATDGADAAGERLV
jgi:hypothetical protein